MSSPAVSRNHIAYFEKDFLDALDGRIDASIMSISDFGEPALVRVNAISKFWDRQSEKIASPRLNMESIISGLFEGGIPIIFGIFGRADRIDVLLGTYGSQNHPAADNLETLKTALRSAFQGVELGGETAAAFEDRIRGYSHLGLVTGTPTAEDREDKRTEKEQIDRMIRGMYGRDWGYLVIAHPARNSEINDLFGSVLNEMRVVANAEKSSGTESPIGKRYNEELESYIKKKLQLAKSQGMWHTAVFLFSKDEETLNHSKAMARSAFSGRESVPDPIRTFNLEGTLSRPGLINNPPPNPPGQFQYPYGLMNTINSVDLASFVHLPSQEMPGFGIKPYSRFNVSRDGRMGEGINVGEILDQDRLMGVDYEVLLDSLTKHGLIVGTTGSGKTNTIFHLLREAWKLHSIPFLVIEPAKTEYRKLLLAEELKDDLRVFTLGDNNISPFRINPFEILPGVPVQTHIDLLKSVFNGSFYMWGILPQVLERCIHEVYTDKGWDLASNSNPRGVHPNANPTMTDLFHKVDEVVEKLGYSGEVTMDLGSALKTRIDSLRIGGKGLMLDTRNSIPLSTLMEMPTILELEPIGNDDEKAFMMGLILTMMYENYVSQGISERTGLKHITVIEEAHRLLANYGGQGAYQANVKGKAVEAFTNILSEIRAYGEGFLIAEQIPTKLSPDVIKNTNLKIMHRIVADDDRKVMGATMNIEDRETKTITALGKGEAAVYSEGDDGAFQVQVPLSKIKGPEGAEKDNEMVVKAMEEFQKNSGHLAPFKGCGEYCRSVCDYKKLGEAVSMNHRFVSQLPSFILSLIDGTDPIDHLLQMLQIGREEGQQVRDTRGIKICAIIQGLDRYLEFLGSRYHWPYEEVDFLKQDLLRIYMPILEEFEQEGALSSKEFGEYVVSGFRDRFLGLAIGQQPTEFCPQVCLDGSCLYRFTLNEALRSDHYYRRFVEIINQGGEGMWEDLRSLCRDAANKVLPKGRDETTRKMALCFALQSSLRTQSFNRRHVSLVMQGLLDLEKVPLGLNGPSEDYQTGEE